jgi:hypothetical protein
MTILFRLTLSIFQCQGLEEEEEGDLPDTYIKVRQWTSDENVRNRQAFFIDTCEYLSSLHYALGLTKYYGKAVLRIRIRTFLVGSGSWP